MQKRFPRIPKASLWAAIVLALTLPVVASATATESFIVQCSPKCDAVAAAISQIPGARVDQVYKNVAGLAVTLPISAVPDIQGRSDVAGMTKDVNVFLPPPDQSYAVGAAEAAQVLDAASLPGFIGARPADYSFNNDLIGATALHNQGTLGTGVVVAIIDSGTANSPVVPALAGSVIGGENFVVGDPVPSATSRLNAAHGTQVGTAIAGHAIFLFATNSVLVQSLLTHAPSAVIPCSQLGCPANLSGVPMIGTAPAASLYALKVFPFNSNSTTTARILAAMDRAITLRRNFNSGMPSVVTNPGCGAEDTPCVYDSLPIQIVNMSLGGGTLFSGRDLEDQLTLEMNKVGITVVVSAGNDGPAAMTVGSPGTGYPALTVAAAATAAHERVLRDVQFGLGIGSLWRPFSGLQTATFSSRGPIPDGRVGVAISANGLATFVQSANGGIALASGTSFSAPIVAGGAALLREKFPTVSGVKIRNAIAATGNPNAFADGSGKMDRGSGLLDLPAAAAKLTSGNVSSTLPVGLTTPIVALNLLPLGITPINFSNNTYTKQLNNLKPGQMVQLYVPTLDNTDNLTVSVQNVTPALPPAQQNQLFGDDIFLTVVDAYTSFADVRVSEFIVADSTFQVPLPQAGLVRVAVQGDTTNAGNVSAKVVITRQNVPLAPPTKSGLIQQGQDTIVRVNVPAGTNQLAFRLSWLREWGAYPTDDIDLILEDPNGNIILDGATLGAPERVSVASPTPGVWTATIQGFQINSIFSIFNSDIWTLRATADGARLAPLP
ncbi:MAG TPA: S8 family serine peptidase [Thermoanaerobaculia bacterium]|nr:S8 family serine peptidase [Thermoanaerobaculia bacterium]